MTKKILIFLLFILILSCSKNNNNAESSDKKKVTLIPWNSALIVKNSLPQGAENNLAGLKRAIFLANGSVQDIKKVYLTNGYIEDGERSNKVNKKRVSITLIEVEANKTNLLVEIRP